MVKDKCFIIAPITTPEDRIGLYGNEPKHCRLVIEWLLAPAVKLAGFEPVLPVADGSALIPVHIVQNLQEASLVLCDMSSLNPNVFFELGIRTAMNKPICLLKDDRTGYIPFDLTLVNSLEYSSDLRTDIVKDTVSEIAKHIKRSAKRTDNDLWKYFGLRIAAENVTAESGTASEAALLRMEVSALRLTLEAQGGSPLPWKKPPAPVKPLLPWTPAEQDAIVEMRTNDALRKFAEGEAFILEKMIPLLAEEFRIEVESFTVDSEDKYVFLMVQWDPPERREAFEKKLRSYTVTFTITLFPMGDPNCGGG